MMIHSSSCIIVKQTPSLTTVVVREGVQCCSAAWLDVFMEMDHSGMEMVVGDYKYG